MLRILFVHGSSWVVASSGTKGKKDVTVAGRLKLDCKDGVAMAAWDERRLEAVERTAGVGGDGGSRVGCRGPRGCGEVVHVQFGATHLG